MVYDVNGNVLVQIDDTLSVEGAAADAKTTGGALDVITTKMVRKESANVWNPDNVVDGYVGTNGTRNTTSTTYKTLTTKIQVEEGDVVRFYGKENSFGPKPARFICAYNSNGNAVTASGANTNTLVYTVPAGITHIIPSLYSKYTDLMVTINAEVATYSPFGEVYYVADYGFLPESVRRTVNIKASDDEESIIDALVDAYNTGNCDVIFERGYYQFGTKLATVENDYNLSVNEIPIGNNCRYYFNGATLEATLDLQTLGVDFYCNFFGCQKNPTNYELHDGILIATDTRYIVHDESNYAAGTYKHVYSNMTMIYRTVNRTEDIRKCIGGGTGKDGVIIITNCKFTTDGTASCVAYHGNAVDVLDAECSITVNGCWFSNQISFNALSEHQTGRVFYTGNSTSAEIYNYGWTITSFLNEIRS